MEIKNLNQIDFSKLNRCIDLVIPAQTAKLSPPVGPTLGQVKIKIKDFCTSFNEVTAVFSLELPLKVVVYVYKNDSFDYIVKPPSSAFLLKNSYIFNNKNILTIFDLYKITLIKKKELQFVSENLIFRNLLILANIMKLKIKIN